MKFCIAVLCLVASIWMVSGISIADASHETEVALVKNSLIVQLA
ncbi:MAG: hypothetical protein AAF206_18845 [Bacteroidota bacterium]